MFFSFKKQEHIQHDVFSVLQETEIPSWEKPIFFVGVEDEKRNTFVQVQS